MLDQDKPQFEALMNASASMYGKQAPEINPVLLKMYFNALDRFPYEDVQSAFEAHIRNPDNGQFFPKPADIIRFMDGNSETKSGEAWTKVDKAIRTIGSYQNIVFDDPIIHAVIADMGGWIQLCKVTNDEYPFKKNEFSKRYTGYVGRTMKDYPKMLIGISQSSNDSRGLKSIEKPAVIGCINQARLVYSGGSDEEVKKIHRVSLDVLKSSVEVKKLDQSKGLENASQ